MNIIEAVEALQAGKAIQRSNWGTGFVKAVQLEDGTYQLYATGDLNPEVFTILSGDFSAKADTEK